MNPPTPTALQTWVSVIQGTAFPIAACIAMALFIFRSIPQILGAFEKINKENNEARKEDRITMSTALKEVHTAFKENTAATQEVVKVMRDTWFHPQQSRRRKAP